MRSAASGRRSSQPSPATASAAAASVAAEIASKAPIATRLAKEAVDRAFEGPLQLGLEYERRLLYLAFASKDTREGLTAFLEKRKPDFKGE